MLFDIFFFSYTAVALIGLLAAFFCLLKNRKAAYPLFRIVLAWWGILLSIYLIGMLIFSFSMANAFSSLSPEEVAFKNKMIMVFGIPGGAGMVAAVGLRWSACRWLGRALIFLIGPLLAVEHVVRIWGRSFSESTGWVLVYLVISCILWVAFEASHAKYRMLSV